MSKSKLWQVIIETRFEECQFSWKQLRPWIPTLCKPRCHPPPLIYVFSPHLSSLSFNHSFKSLLKLFLHNTTQQHSRTSKMRMSCNGCRVLRKGCSEDCTIRPCLQWIKTPESQAHATLFLAKFYGRAGLVNLINAGPQHLRPGNYLRQKQQCILILGRQNYI